MKQTKRTSKLMLAAALALLPCAMYVGMNKQIASAEGNAPAGVYSVSTAEIEYTVSEVQILSTYTERYTLVDKCYHVIGGTVTINSLSSSVKMPEDEEPLIDSAVAAALTEKLTAEKTYTTPSVTISDGYQTGYYSIEIDWKLADIQCTLEKHMGGVTQISKLQKNRVPREEDPTCSVCYYRNYNDTEPTFTYSISSFKQ